MAGKDKKNFIIEAHSPYFLHPCEGPGIIITAVVFDGKNYELWQRAIQTALRAKNKLGFIEGTLKRPETATEQEFSEADAWDLVNSMLCSWLLNVIEPKLWLNVAYIEIAHEIWEDLRKRYSVANLPKIHQLKAAIANCKQGNLDIGDFYAAV